MKKQRNIKIANSSEMERSLDELSDKVSEILDRHSSILHVDLLGEEIALRSSLIHGFSLFVEARKELGKVLYELRNIYKSHRVWTRIAEELGSAIQRDKRTIFRMILDYEKKVGLRPASHKISIDLSDDELIGTFNGNALTDDQERFLETLHYLELAIRDYPANERFDAFTSGLETLAYRWGYKENFSLTLRPHPSPVQIRKTDESGAEDGTDQSMHYSSALVDYGSERGHGLMVLQ